MTESAGFWDRVAERYAARPIRDVAAYEEMLADVASRLAATDRVLELGCGTGGAAVRLGGGVALWRATDFSAEMLRIARARQAPPTVEFRQAEADSAFDGGPWDAVCAFHVLHLVEDTEATLRRIHAHLKPGGLLISKTYCFGDMGLGLRLMFPLLRSFGMFPPEASLTLDRLRRAILDAGFGIEQQRSFGRNLHSRYIVARRL
ncbi:class I SAM-dependent methyltransferase [Cereibacter changlensis]|uniref:class I SAM-dependent methyltransferase n=1 Tax=Cereibacter changlensis TaxID=402884 RepID=UPI0040344E85